ncbi:MAG TPA: (4Fe-4S)-binding protein [Bacteroidia bacterium]|jgi:putative redox protein|nr:(4Fe-4S)-binding protein [Bacteroidia bacterium]
MQYKFDKPVQGTIGIEKYQCKLEWRNGTFISDEPATSGGKDTGPDPYTLLLSSLASCTLVTLRMYIDRKGWDIPRLTVQVNMYTETKGEQVVNIIDRDIVFPESATEDQKVRLQEIARHCPVSKILEGEVKIRTFILKEGETEKKIKYSNGDITVVWKPEFCQHSTRCWAQLPEVFDYKKKKWINPDGAPADRIEEQVRKCPSGALTFYHNRDQ